MLKGVSKTTENEEKEQKSGFRGMLLGILSYCLAGNMLVFIRTSEHASITTPVEFRLTIKD